MIQITRTKDSRGFPAYDVTPDAPVNRHILDAMRSWSRASDLATYAEGRYGYSNSDGGFGVTYPGDLDADEREYITIEEGMVMVYAFFGPPDGSELAVPEAHYLECLAAFLDANALGAEAGRVRALIAAASG